MNDVVIDTIGGNCPVQAKGTIFGNLFYFRARGDHWSISIGGADPVMHPEWYYEQDYGQWPEAGGMTKDEVINFIHWSAARFKGQSMERVVSSLENAQC